MQIYLPIAEMSVNIFTFLVLGGIIGLISGFFSIGGGFLLTPLLIFMGIPPTIAVATVPSQIVASLTSSVLSYFKKGAIDMKLAIIMSTASVLFSFLGIISLNLLRQLGQLDIIIAFSYIILLGTVGTITIAEALITIFKNITGNENADKDKRPGRIMLYLYRMQNLPYKIHFRKSNLRISVIPVLVIGAFIGFIGTLLGVGGGFILIPLLVYLLRLPNNVIAGVAAFNILITMISATMVHALTNQTVDIILAIILMFGGVIGVNFGRQAATKIKAEHLRLLLGALIMLVAIRFLLGLFIPPGNPFIIQ